MQERKVFHNLVQQLGRNGTGAAAVVQTIRTLEKILSPHHIQLSPLLDHRADTPHGRGFSPSAAEDSLDLWFKDPKKTAIFYADCSPDADFAHCLPIWQTQLACICTAFSALSPERWPVFEAQGSTTLCVWGQILHQDGCCRFVTTLFLR